MAAGDKTLKTEFRVPADKLRQLSKSFLRNTTGGFKWKRLGAQAELKHDFVGPLFQGGQKCFSDVGREDVAFRGAGLSPVTERVRHFLVRREPVIDVRRKACGGGNHLVVRYAVTVV